MRVVQLGSPEMDAAKAELADIMLRGFDWQGDIQQELVCDECGSAGQKMLRLEVGAEKHLHDICPACLAEGIRRLEEV